MSRVTAQCEKFLAAFGADHWTGSFIQIWLQPEDDQDIPLVVIDNMGIRTSDDYEDTLPSMAISYLDTIRERYAYSARHGNPKPNIDAETVWTFLEKCGMPDQASAVLKAFD